MPKTFETPVTIDKCPCGDKYCKDYHLSIGKFIQGSGFTLEVAEEIARMLNANVEAKTLDKSHELTYSIGKVRNPKFTKIFKRYSHLSGFIYRMIGIYGANFHWFGSDGNWRSGHGAT